MPPDTKKQKDTSAPTPTIEISKLSARDVVWATTEGYLYKLNVCVPLHSVIMVETGDITVGDKNHFEVLSVQKDKPLRLTHPHEDDRVTPPVVHASVSGVSEDGPWSYEVF
jgi:hypothetical protein